MADEKVILDCSLGTVIRSELSLSEQAQRRDDAQLQSELASDREAKATRREFVLNKMANTVGLDVDEIKDALGVGNRPVQERPQRQRRTPTS